MAAADGSAKHANRSSGGSKSTLFDHRDDGLAQRTQFGKNFFHILFLFSRCKLEESCTWRSTSAFSTSSRVALNEVTRVCGRLLMKPTVSDRRTFCVTEALRRAAWGPGWRTCATRPTRQLRKPIEERALAGVGVANQGDRRHRYAARRCRCCVRTRRTSSSSRLSCSKLALNLAPVGFQLGFAGSPGPDSAAKLRHGCASPGQPRQTCTPTGPALPEAGLRGCARGARRCRESAGYDPPPVLAARVQGSCSWVGVRS